MISKLKNILINNILFRSLKIKKETIKLLNKTTYRIINGETYFLKTRDNAKAFNIHGKRVYLSEVPNHSPFELVMKLRELSLNFDAIQIELDIYKEKYYLEIEFYLKLGTKDLDTDLSLTEKVKGIEIEEKYYQNLLYELRYIPIKMPPASISKTRKYLKPI